MRPRRAPAGIVRSSIVRLARREPAGAHVVAERRDVDPFRNLGLGDERAGAATADEVALADELVESRANGETGDAEIDAELALGWDRVAGAERLDQLEDPLAGLALLAQVPDPTSEGWAAGSRRAPESGSK